MVSIALMENRDMKFDYIFPSDGACHIEMQECFAYDGIKKIGMIDKYRCGILKDLKAGSTAWTLSTASHLK